MKGLAALPSPRDLAHAYNDIQGRIAPLPVAALATCCQWARLDPRLAEILVEHIARHWSDFPLGQLVEALARQPWPRAALVLFRFAELSMPKAAGKTLHQLIRVLAASLDPIPPQLFFIPLQRPNLVVLREEVRFRTDPYTLSGFVGSQSLLRHSLWPADKTHLGKEARGAILAALRSAGRTLSVLDYQKACRGLVSRRQAQRDLAAAAGLVAKGYTRGRRYS